MNKRKKNTKDVLVRRKRTSAENPDQIVEKTLQSIFEEVYDSDNDHGADEMIEGGNSNGRKEHKANRKSSKSGRQINADDAEESQIDDKADESGYPESEAFGDDIDGPDIHYLDFDEPLSQYEEREGRSVSQEDEEEFEDEDDEIDYDSLEDDDDLEMEADDKVKKHRRRKKVGFTLLGIVLLLTASYMGISWYFMSHFYYATKINDNDFGLKTVAQVEDYLSEQVSGYSLTLKEIDGKTESISGDDIDISYKKSDELKKLLKKQNPFLWPKAFWEDHKIAAEVGVQYDSSKLSAVLNGLKCMVAENQTPSVSAKPKFSEKEFIVEPEVIGTQVNTEVFNSKVNEYIKGFVSELDMDKEECYLKPPFVSDSKEVVDATAKLNQYLKATITYEVSPQTEVLDQAVIAGWLSTDENMQVQFNTDAVWEYVAGLSGKYNTVGTKRKFTTANGNVVEVSGGKYGWWINEQAEYDMIIQNIEAGEPVTREPQFSSWGAAHGADNDYGNTYAEVDLTAQYMWFFKDGAIVMESHIVTGKPSTGAATPQGSYRLTYKTKNAVLRGQRYPDGTYEYESPVAFWMPFNGGIGFHDASWQAAFGGNRYITHGSHGCINLPYSAAEQLYSLIQDDTPIILHY